MQRTCRCGRAVDTRLVAVDDERNRIQTFEGDAPHYCPTPYVKPQWRWYDANVSRGEKVFTPVPPHDTTSEVLTLIATELRMMRDAPAPKPKAEPKPKRRDMDPEIPL